MKVQDVKYERLIEILNSTNPNVALISLHVDAGFVNGTNGELFNIEISTGYRKYTCKDTPAWTDVFEDLDYALSHLPSSCFID